MSCHHNSQSNKAGAISLNMVDTPPREYREAFDALSGAPAHFSRLANDLVSGTVNADPVLVKQYLAAHAQFKKHWKPARDFQGRKARKVLREIDRLAHLVLGEVQHEQSR